MNKAEIETVLSELSKVTGLRASLHDANYKEIAAYPKDALPFCARVNSDEGEHKKCMQCDRDACERAIKDGSTVIYKCRFGLTESVSPLYNFGELTGFLMMGQVAESDDERELAKRTARDIAGAAKDADGIPIVSRDMIISYTKIMSICAKYLTLSNATSSKKPPVVTAAMEYIEENIKEKILIKDICESIGCSKTTLINTFKRDLGVTVNEYITEKRLTMAEHLLASSNLSAARVASVVGFSDQAYFSKVFSARYGVPPGKYKRHIKRG